MAAFEYVALDAKGKRKKGVLEGDAARAVRQSLREKGLTPLEVNAVSERSKSGKTPRFGGRLRVSVAELSLLTRQLATLVKAGLPLEEALQAVGEQSESSRVQSVLMAVRSRVKEGHPLAMGMADHPKVFPEMYRSSVHAGEETAHLDSVLERLSDYVENSQERRQRIQGAMIYPLVLLGISLLVVGFLMTNIVPKMVRVYESRAAELPGLTKAVMNVSEFLQSYGLALVLGLIVLGYLVHKIFSQAGPKYWLHKQWLRVPLLKHLVRGSNTAQFASTLSILAGSGVPILDSLRISSEVITNLPMKEAVDNATIKVREGAPMHRSLAQTKLFPPMMTHLIASGEASGQLENMLDRAAKNQERELDARINTFIGLLGPLMILLMGGMVLMIVMALLMPIFNLQTLM